MDIQHRVDKTRVVKGVEFEPRRAAYVTVINDVLLLYPVQHWQPADTDLWIPAQASVEKEGKVLAEGSAHVAGILNSNYRFVMTGGVLSLQKLK